MAYYELPPSGSAGATGRRWLQTAVAAVAGTALLVLAFFFALFAVAAGLLLLAGIAARWWWVARRMARAGAPEDGMRPRSSSTVVEGEYRVVERPRTRGDGRDENR